AIGPQLAQQSPDNSNFPSGHEGLRFAYRAGNAVRIRAVRVHGRDLAALELLLEHEADVLERAPLAVRVAHQGERRLPGRAQQRQGVCRETWRLAHRLDARARDAL